jgi:hypothetical protein
LAGWDKEDSQVLLKEKKLLKSSTGKERKGADKWDQGMGKYLKLTHGREESWFSGGDYQTFL